MRLDENIQVYRGKRKSVYRDQHLEARRQSGNRGIGGQGLDQPEEAGPARGPGKDLLDTSGGPRNLRGDRRSQWVARVGCSSGEQSAGSSRHKAGRSTRRSDKEEGAPEGW